MRILKCLSLAVLCVGLVAASPSLKDEMVLETVLQPDIKTCDTLHNTRNCENYHVVVNGAVAVNSEITLNDQKFVIKDLAVAYHLAAGKVEKQPITSWANDGSFVAPKTLQLSDGTVADVVDVRLNLTVKPK